MIYNLSLLIVIIIISSIFVYYLCDFSKLKYYYKNYLKTLLDLKETLSYNNKIKNINYQKKLNNVSLTGTKVIFYTFKFLIPYFVCYLLIRFLVINIGSEIFMIIISSSPYLIIIKQK